MIDTHCHILPNLDDGPFDWDGSLQLAQALCADGITEVIATVHQLGQFNNLDMGQHIRQSVSLLNGILDEADIDLKVYPGAEVRIDQRIHTLLTGHNILTLADSRFLLLELPSEVLIDIEPLIRDLAKNGFVIVIAHAERLLYLQKNPYLLRSWQNGGALFQVTAPGLLGRWGSDVRDHAWHLVLSGAASLLATDAHDTILRKPELTIARQQIAARVGSHIADKLCTINPQAILNNRPIEPLFRAQIPIESVPAKPGKVADLSLPKGEASPLQIVSFGPTGQNNIAQPNRLGNK